MNTKGYLRFTIRIGDSSPRSVEVHKLMGYQKYGDEIFRAALVLRHKNENPHDNRPDNILIGTQHDNMMDRSPEARKAHALIAARVQRKLSMPQIGQLKKDRKSGMKYRELSEKYGIPKSSVSYILREITYVQA